jgi:hypothetical protein
MSVALAALAALAPFAFLAFAFAFFFGAGFRLVAVGGAPLVRKGLAVILFDECVERSAVSRFVCLCLGGVVCFLGVDPVEGLLGAC